MDILFAENSKRKTVELKPETVKDLALQDLLDNISDTESEMIILRDIFTHIPIDTNDTRYRSEILKDFLENDAMTDEMSDALSYIRTLKDYGHSKLLQLSDDRTLYVLLEHLRELMIYIEATEAIVSCLKKHKIRSTGLRSVLSRLESIVTDDKFELAKKDVKKMLHDLSNVKGAFIGVNFTPDLNIEQVTSVEFVPYRIRSKYKFAEIAAFISNVNSNAMASNSVGKPWAPTRVIDPLLVSMTPNIEKHLKLNIIRIKHIMNKYVKLDSSSITELYEGLTYYLCMTKLSRRLRKEGCEICLPEITDTEGIKLDIKDLYNIRLFFAGEKNIVKNDFSFSPEENLFILTGPNRGGKTIIEQALGIISIMAAIGSFVTASSCKGRPFHNILTHFPIDENLTINYGRLGEEAIRIKEIVKEADDKTLILFNETYSTTSAADGLYLSKDLLRILKEHGTAVVFNTHIHELARSLDEMNRWDGQSKFVSLVMEIKDNVNTFRVKRSDPESKSYAKNIAEKYGITYEQMKNAE